MEQFEQALRILFPLEGGYSDNPNDRGGKTNLGITEGTLNAAYQAGIVGHNDVQRLTRQEAEQVYYRLYWLRGQCDKIPVPKLATVHFDGCVNHGIGGAGVLLQRVIAILTDTPLTLDGSIGPKTLSVLDRALARNSDAAVALSVIAKRADLYRYLVIKRPQNREFIMGWLNRISKLQMELGI